MQKLSLISFSETDQKPLFILHNDNEAIHYIVHGAKWKMVIGVENTQFVYEDDILSNLDWKIDLRCFQTANYVVLLVDIVCAQQTVEM